MINDRLSLPASKAELQPSPADRRLEEQRRRAGRIHRAVEATASSADPTSGCGLRQALAVQLTEPAPQHVQKSEEVFQDARIANLGLSPDGGLLLDKMLIEANELRGRPVNFTVERAGELLGIGRHRADLAKAELLRRNLIRPQINNLGGSDGYRVMPFGAQ